MQRCIPPGRFPHAEFGTATLGHPLTHRLIICLPPACLLLPAQAPRRRQRELSCGWSGQTALAAWCLPPGGGMGGTDAALWVDGCLTGLPRISSGDSGGGGSAALHRFAMYAPAASAPPSSAAYLPPCPCLPRPPLWQAARVCAARLLLLPRPQQAQPVLREQDPHPAHKEGQRPLTAV